MIPKGCKRLAEVDFPIAEVSRHAAREKSIRHGHPSTLHLWWARRPLASSRAVLLGLLWPDPCDPKCPSEFKQQARELLPTVGGCNPGKTDGDLQKALLKFIAAFANWDNSAKPAYLEVSRALVKSAHGEEPPLVVDPFAGGGSIPLEALRVGCEAFASDLNPVACLILKVMLEDIPRHGPGLADELRRVGTGIARGEQIELSKLIDILNERFGTDFKPADQLFLDSIREDAIADAGIRQAAMANTMENFGYVFLKALEGLFIDRMEQNEDITARFINDKEFQDVVGKSLLKTVYEQIRSEKPSLEPFRRVTALEKDKYRTCVPLLKLKAAAGAFGDVQAVEPDGWVEPHTERRLGPGMFVAQVVGRSMEPRIPDGGWCLFQSPVEGSRRGRVVLVQHRDIDDPETGGAYTVKRYESDKESDGSGSWRHTEIRLLPENRAFTEIILKDVRDDEFHIIAEVVEVLR